MKVLVTGAAGFIGFHVSQQLLARGDQVIGIDNLNDYYDPKLKKDRLVQIQSHDNFQFEKIDIGERETMETFFANHKDIDAVVHLAAQAGVRYSLENPHAYIHSNINGHLNLLEGVRHSDNRINNFVYASSSSVYGGNQSEKFSVEDSVDSPFSLYAATKKSNELMTYCYSHLYNFPAIGLRFFTVYGPWGRPDMAPCLFADAMANGRPINVFNHGDMMRDFTYIDDIVAGVLASLDTPPSIDEKGVRHKVYNLGNNKSERLMDFIENIEKCLGVEAEKNMMPMQPGDAPKTFADIDITKQDLGYDPKTNLSEGIPKFIQWFKDYNNID